MSIEQNDFDAITAQDFNALVDAQVPEGLRLDFKLTIYGKSDSDKRELLKDVSALANSHGGHIIIGIEEAEGAATQVVGIEEDSDAEILRMEQIIRNGLEPAISGIRMRPIPLDSGKKVLLLRIPKSWNPPHRVVAQGVNRFYLRHSAGVHEPSIEELRALFSQSATALEQARRFRDERLAYIASRQGIRPLEDEGRLVLHIVPVAAFSGMVQVDVESIHANEHAFWPLGATGMSPRFNYFGYINERGGDKNHGYTQVFRNGIVEATKASIVRQSESGPVVAGLALERSIFERFSNYVFGLRDLGVSPPLIVMFTFEGVHGARYAVSANPWNDPEPLLEGHVLTLPECLIEDYGTKTEMEKAVRPAFDALWNAIGYSRSQFFNEDGAWIGERKGS